MNDNKDVTPNVFYIYRINYSHYTSRKTDLETNFITLLFDFFETVLKLCSLCHTFEEKLKFKQYFTLIMDMF